MNETHANHLLEVAIKLDLPDHNLTSGQPCPGRFKPPSMVKKQKGAIVGACRNIEKCGKYGILGEITAPADPNDGALFWALVDLK